MDTVLYTFKTKNLDGVEITYTIWEHKDGSHSVDCLKQTPLTKRQYESLLSTIGEGIDYAIDHVGDIDDYSLSNEGDK